VTLTTRSCKAIWKLEPKWLVPQRVISHTKNSYKLESLGGLPIGGRFSSRGLRRFIPRDGTSLPEAQREKALGLAEEKADVEGEAEGVSVGDEGVGTKVDREDERLNPHPSKRKITGKIQESMTS